MTDITITLNLYFVNSFSDIPITVVCRIISLCYNIATDPIESESYHAVI